MLPKSKIPTDVVILSGGETAVRGMTRAEVIALAKVGEKQSEKADSLVLSYGFDVSVDEAEEWLAGASAGDAQKAIEAVLCLSGMLDGQGKD